MKKITKDMTFAQVLTECSNSVEVFASFKIYCVGCPMASRETIEQGCKTHGLDVEKVLEELNKRCKND